MNHYIHNSIPDAKFEADSFLSFSRYDVTKVLSKRRERVIKFGYLSPETSLALKKMSFYVQNSSSRPKIDPRLNFSNFQAEENFFIFQIFGTSRREKSSSNNPPPRLFNFAKILSELVLRIKTKSHQVWAS